MANTSILKIGEQPTEVKLRFDPRQGTKKPSKFRECEFLHMVNDGQMVYLDPQAHEQLIATGAGAGDLVRLKRSGRGNEAHIEVSLVLDAAEPVKPSVPPPAPVAAVEEKPLARPAAEMLKGALYAAIDASIAAEEYARTKGRALTFTEESIRAMAHTLFINAAKGTY